ncbi:MAG: hypothetical protein CSA32_04400 [Desulfobulbus propionicus]|nr:MAG: hypothetical protein CSA32_04400 [Desulfobulbus propionicus]
MTRYPPVADAVLFSLFFATLGVSAFTFTFPLLAADRAIAGIWLGSGFSGYFLIKLILAPLIGNLADRVGARPLLLAGVTLGTVTPWLYLVFPSSFNLYLVQFVLGFAGGIIRPLGMAVIGTEADEQQHGAIFGRYNLLFNLAVMSGPLIAGLLFFIGPTTPLLLFLSGTQLVSMIILYTFLSPAFSLTGDDKSDDPGLQPNIFSMLPLMTAVAGRTFGLAVMISFYPLLLRETLIAERIITAVYFAVPTLFTCLTLPLAKQWNNTINRIRATFFGMLTSAAGLLVVSYFSTPAGFVCAGILLGIGAGVSAPAAMAQAVSFAGKKGGITGWFHLAANLGFIAGPVFAGVVVQQTGSMTAPFWGAGFIGIAACFPLFLQNMRDRHRHFFPFTRPGLIFLTVLGILVIRYPPFTSLEKQYHGIRYKYTNIAMETVVRMTLEHENEQHADKAAKEAMSLIHALQQDYDHHYREGSIGRINEAAGRESVVVTEKAGALLQRALVFCAHSGGVFDISIGAITRTAEYFRKEPAQQQQNLVDYRLVDFDTASRRVFLPREGMALDLGGLAKGTIIDAAVGSLRKNGIKGGIVEAGGDLFCFGARKWRCGLQHPRKKELLGIIEVQNKAVCGSGDYYQFVMSEKNGKMVRKHHIMDLATGDSAQKSISVTTIAAATELADALATTLFIMGPVDGQKFLDKYYPDAAALWVLPDLKTVATANFPSFLTPGK